MAYEDILYDIDDGIATIKFNRPQAMNAGTGNTYQELEHAFRAAADDDDVRVIILTGEGRAFSAGDDVKQTFLAKPDNSEEARSRRLLGQLQSLRTHGKNSLDPSIIECPKPTIASVNGAAIGYGCDLALMCDIRIAGDEAKMGEFFVRRGLTPTIGALMILPRIIGLARAYELVLSGRLVESEELGVIGMVNRVVPQAELGAETLKLAREIASQGPLGQMMAKEGIRMGMNWEREKMADYQTAALSLLFQTEDHREGVASFLERRESDFKAR